MPDSIQSMQMIGPIGSFTIDGVQYNGIELEDVVSYVSLLPKNTKLLLIDISTPGGLKSTGDSIYNYLMSLKPKMKIIMNQVGPIGSIGTKIVFAGDERIALDDGTNNWMIHNPWTGIQGDAQTLIERGLEMSMQEDELRNFYMAQTGITKEGIAPLMKVETAFNADKAVALKFATSSRKALNIAAYNMKNKNTTVGQRLDNLVALIAKAISPTLSMVVLKIAGGAPIAVDAPDPDSIQGAKAYTCDATGAPTQTPAPDGQYQVDQDDMKFTVAGGVVTAVDDPDAVAPVTPAAANQNGILEQIAQAVAAAQKDPTKATALATDIGKLLAKKPVKKAVVDPDEDDEENEEADKLTLAIEKIEKLLTSKKEKTAEEKLLALVDTKVTEALSKIKTVKKPAIKVFKKPEDYKSPAQSYLES